VLLWILSIIVGGLIIGALGRLIVPGPNPMGLVATILVGIAGAFLGGLVARVIWPDPQNHSLALIVMEVLAAALITFAVAGRRRSRTYF
jgi:uncharacterized membrane protein YeaQ/YmgE (transglycosylase-associated protein family)